MNLPLLDPTEFEPRQLAPDYYLVNFRCLVDHVFQLYQDLLERNELQFYSAFCAASGDAQKLLVRMLMRKGEVFRADKLVYADIEDTAQAASELASAGLIEINPPLASTVILPLFSKSEWLEMVSVLPLPRELLVRLRHLKRAEFNEVIAALLEEFELGAQQLGPLYRLCGSECFEVFKLLFFGQLRQDLSEFVVRDLGHVRYEPYSVDPVARLFNSRRQIEQHLQYFALLSELDACLAGEREDMVRLAAALPEPEPEDRTLQRRVERVRLMLARQLERLGCLDDALALYRQCRLAPARERSARILAKRADQARALELCRQMAEQPVAEEEVVFAERFGHRLAKSLNLPWPKPQLYQPPCETLALPFTGDPVELAVANHLSAQGDCHYVENQLFCTLFALHHWDVIFAPVRGAFTHPFQAGPHDLFEPDFLQSRTPWGNQAESALLSLPEGVDHYLELWRRKVGTALPLAAWHAIDEALLAKALVRIPPAAWRCVFTRLWSDLRHNRCGLPDLIHFPGSGGYELVEVKGPGDRLQANQQRWMAYFARHAIPHKVVQVVWCD